MRRLEASVQHQFGRPLASALLRHGQRPDVCTGVAPQRGLRSLSCSVLDRSTARSSASLSWGARMRQLGAYSSEGERAWHSLVPPSEPRRCRRHHILSPPEPLAVAALEFAGGRWLMRSAQWSSIPAGSICAIRSRHAMLTTTAEPLPAWILGWGWLTYNRPSTDGLRPISAHAPRHCSPFALPSTTLLHHRPPPGFGRLETRDTERTRSRQSRESRQSTVASRLARRRHVSLHPPRRPRRLLVARRRPHRHCVSGLERRQHPHQWNRIRLGPEHQARLARHELGEWHLRLSLRHAMDVSM